MTKDERKQSIVAGFTVTELCVALVGISALAALGSVVLVSPGSVRARQSSDFPALPALKDRARLWPPDLSALPNVLLMPHSQSHRQTARSAQAAREFRKLSSAREAMLTVRVDRSMMYPKSFSYLNTR